MPQDFEHYRRQARLRFRRVKRFLKPLPRRTNVARYPVIKWFAEAARARPFLWSFKKQHVIAAFYAGSVVALLPLWGMQLLLAFFAALLARANLAITVSLQFITNPLTIAPIYYLTYKVGMWVIDKTGLMHGPSAMGTRINALFIGGVVLGLAVAVLLDLLYRFALWETEVFKRRFSRSRRRAHAAQAKADGAQADAAAGETAVAERLVDPARADASKAQDPSRP